MLMLDKVVWEGRWPKVKDSSASLLEKKLIFNEEYKNNLKYYQ